MHTTAHSNEPERQWRSRLAATFWGLSTAALVVFGSGVLYATAVEVRRLTRTLPARPPEVVRDIIVRNAPDHKGRRASFRILLFSDEFRWRINSYAALESTPTQPDFTTEMRAVLNDAREIICVGASSEEIPSGVSFEKGRLEEERRAGRRAERIAVWVRGALTRPIPVRKLNVGHHAPTGQARRHLRSAPCRHHSRAGRGRENRCGSGAPGGHGPRECTRADLRRPAHAVFPGNRADVHLG